MDRLDVGNGDDAVALHDVQADARDPAVGLVVDEQVLAVVLAVGHRDVRMVAVAVEETCAVAEDPLALVGQAPAGGRVDVEHRYAHQLAHRRHAEHAYFAGMSAAPEPVVLIQFAGGDLGLAALALARGPASRPTTALPRALAPTRAAAPVSAEAPRKPRRFRPWVSSWGFSCRRSSRVVLKGSQGKGSQVRGSPRVFARCPPARSSRASCACSPAAGTCPGRGRSSGSRGSSGIRWPRCGRPDGSPGSRIRGHRAGTACRIPRGA